MRFEHYIPSRILFGRGILEELHNRKLPGKKALIVTSSGNSVKRYGYLAKLERQLELAGVEHVLFDRILPNPIKDHVMEGAELARQEGCDFIVGLGGGSSIDSAKAIAIMAVNVGDYWDYISGGSGKGLEVPNHPLPIVAVTTTAGTGTEADPWTVISNGSEKIGGGYDDTFPVLSVVDPELMTTVPPALTAYQGFDALFHSTEGYLNRNANVISDLYAIKAIELIGESLETAIRYGDDMDAREKMALANTLAGMVESASGCISEHSIEHAMSGRQPKLPHGAGLIMISRAYYTFMAEFGSCDQRMIDMAKALGYREARRPMDFVIVLTKLQEVCRVDSLKMSDYGIQEGDLSTIASESRRIMGGLFEDDPCEVSREDVEEILRRSYR